MLLNFSDRTRTGISKLISHCAIVNHIYPSGVPRTPLERLYCYVCNKQTTLKTSVNDEDNGLKKKRGLLACSTLRNEKINRKNELEGISHTTHSCISMMIVLSYLTTTRRRLCIWMGWKDRSLRKIFVYFFPVVAAAASSSFWKAASISCFLRAILSSLRLRASLT